MRTIWILAVLVLAAGSAVAGKPTDAQAKKAAADWVAAMHFKVDAKLDGATLLTAGSLWFAAYDDEGAKCGQATATTAAAIGKALACLHGNIDPSGRLGVWTKKSGLHLWGPLAAHRKQLEALAKTATLVEFHDGCDGNESWVIVAVTRDAKNAARVSAVLSEHMACSE